MARHITLLTSCEIPTLNQRLRVAIIAAKPPWSEHRGGATGTAYLVALRLARVHDVSVVSFSNSETGVDKVVDGIRFVLLPHSPTSIRGRLAVLRNPIVRECELLIESDDLGGPWFVPGKRRRILLAHQFWQEVFVEEVRAPVGALLKLLEPWFYLPYRRVPTVLGSISASAERSLRSVGIDNILRVPFGFQSDSDDPTPLPGRDLQPSPILSIVCRLRRYKGVQFALNAMPEILDRFPNARLVVMGQGPYQESLKQVARDLGLVESVDFRGFVEDRLRQDILRHSYLSIAPSIREGYGFNVLDAFRAGTPVVGWDVPGTQDVIQSGTTGILVKNRSPSALAAAICELLTDPDRRDALAQAAFRWQHSIHIEDGLQLLDEWLTQVLNRELE